MKGTSMIQMIPLSKLVGTDFNPLGRTRDVSDLKAAIEEFGGQVNAGHVISRNDGLYDLICGHRRKKALEELGYTTMLVHIHPIGTDKYKLYSLEARGTRAFTSLDFMTSWLMSGKKTRIPKQVQSKIKLAAKVFGGDKGIAYLISKQTGPDCGKLIMDLKHQLDTVLGEQGVRIPSIRTIGVWLVENKAHHDIHQYKRTGEIENKTTLKRVLNAVLSGKSLNDPQKRGRPSRLGSAPDEI